MWAKVDDKKIRDRKILHAARLLGGRYGHARVVAVWLEGTLYCNAHGTDGLIARAVARKFIADPRPCDVLDVMSFALTPELPGLTALHGEDYLLVDHLADQPSAADWAADQARRKSQRQAARATRRAALAPAAPGSAAAIETGIVPSGPASAPLGVNRLVSVATAAARAVLADVAVGEIDPADAKEALKALLARARMPSDSTLVNAALDRAERAIRVPRGTRAVRTA